MSENADHTTQTSRFRRVGHWTPQAIAGGIVIGALGLVAAYKLLVSNFSFSLVDLSTTDLLSLILAFFSIWLSMMFYWRAEDSSKRFYDDTYKFTKDTSNMLGRIEAVFGTHFEHLNAGYERVVTSMERMAASEMRAEEDVETQEEKVKAATDDAENLINDLAKRAKLSEDEKDELQSRLAKLQQDLFLATSELASAKGALEATRAANAEAEARLRIAEVQRAELLHERHRRNSPSEVEELTVRDQRALLTELLPYVSRTVSPDSEHHLTVREIPPRMRRLLMSAGLVSSDGTLTLRGRRLVADALDRGVNPP